MKANYFPSGSNHEGEIEGFALIGANVGVAADQLTDDAVAALEKLAGTGTLVFVDSGAFGEVRFGPGGPAIINPISDAEWRRRLALYLRLAAALGPQLFAVAPDCVGFQDVTLARLERYAADVLALHASGANVIVPLQNGLLTLAELDARVVDILGFDDFVRGIPSKKGATTTPELVGLLAARSQAKRVHLLGLGPASKRWPSVIAALERVRPELDLFCDSVLITAHVGKTNGRRGGPRALTKASDDHWHDELAPRSFCDAAHDWTDNTDLASWATPSDVKAIADGLTLSAVERAAFLQDPDAWLQEDDRYSWPHIDHVIGQAWANRYYFRAIVTERKREGVVRTFGAPAFNFLRAA